VLAIAVLAGACAEKRVAPVPGGAPRYPEFVFPEAPADLAPPEAVEHQRLGWQYLQAGDLRNADREFAAALKLAPAFYPAEAALGYAALARKDAGSAVSHFDRALAGNAAYAPALAGKGDALLSQNHPEEALQAFEAALAANPDLPGLRSRVDVLKFRTAQQSIAAARKAAEDGHLEDARRSYATAIAESPESAFLYRELAAVDRQLGDTAAALAHAKQAATLDPADARAQVLLGEIYEARREWASAADAYTAAAALEPGDALSARADAMRERMAFESMPPEYRTIDQAATVTRAQLAALLGVRLEDLLRRARAESAPVITDTRGNWAAPWILAVTRAGVMDVFPNHTFQPGATVRRGDLAAAVSRVLSRIAVEKPRLAVRWRDPRPHFSDLGPAHLSYPAAARAVSAGIMEPDGDAFQLSRPVTGPEAIQAVSRLEALARSK
jgi:tetratricopeptide (TPR) repeat protein